MEKNCLICFVLQSNNINIYIVNCGNITCHVILFCEQLGVK